MLLVVLCVCVATVSFAVAIILTRYLIKQLKSDIPEEELKYYV